MMSNLPGYEVPEYMWWCKTCNGGVGCWGLGVNGPPPRCPACHDYNFEHIKFVPDDKAKKAEADLRRVWALLTEGNLEGAKNICLDYVAASVVGKRPDEVDLKDVNLCPICSSYMGADGCGWCKKIKMEVNGDDV